MTAIAPNGRLSAEARLDSIESALSDHELRLVGAEKREELLVDLRDALQDVHKSLAGQVALLRKQRLDEQQERAILRSQMAGLSESVSAMKDHVTRESTTRATEIEREKIARQSLARANNDASHTLEAATPTAHARQLMMASTLAVSVIAKNLAEEVSHNHVAAWAIVAIVLVGGYWAARKRRSVP